MIYHQIPILTPKNYFQSCQFPIQESSDNVVNHIQAPTSTWIGSPELELIIDSDRYVLTVIANKIHESRLPMELRPAAIEVFNNAQDVLRKCEFEFADAHHQVWIFKTCIADLLRESITLLETIGQQSALSSTDQAVVDLSEFRLK